MIVCERRSAAADEDKVIPRLQLRVQRTDAFTQKAPRTVPLNRVADLFAGRNTHARLLHLFIAQAIQHKRRAHRAFSAGVNALILVVFGQRHKDVHG